MSHNHSNLLFNTKMIKIQRIDEPKQARSWRDDGLPDWWFSKSLELNLLLLVAMIRIISSGGVCAHIHDSVRRTQPNNWSPFWMRPPSHRPFWLLPCFVFNLRSLSFPGIEIETTGLLLRALSVTMANSDLEQFLNDLKQIFLSFKTKQLACN